MDIIILDPYCGGSVSSSRLPRTIHSNSEALGRLDFLAADNHLCFRPPRTSRVTDGDRIF